MNTETPEALKVEHAELRDHLQKAAQAGGKTAAAALKVMKVLHPHILLEEEFAIPPLVILPRLARGEPTPDMRRYLAPAEMLETQLPRMLEEHKLIVEALRALMQAAQDEGHAGYAGYARKMIVHAQLEEEILYPHRSLSASTSAGSSEMRGTGPRLDPPGRNDSDESESRTEPARE